MGKRGKRLSNQDAVLGLLIDYAAFRAAFGGALPLDESHLHTASYGPAGYIETATEFHEEGNVKLLSKSYKRLNGALRFLRRDHPELFEPLIEAYLADPGDPSIITHWRRLIAAMDRENDLRRRAKPPKPQIVALEKPRDLLERHDKAIERLAEYLRDGDLYYIPVSQLSESEAKADEHREQQIYASYQRYRNAGNRSERAVELAADEFSTSTDKVETVIEFRRNVKADECSQAGCDRAPFRGTLCCKHYFEQRRVESKSKNAS